VPQLPSGDAVGFGIGERKEGLVGEHLLKVREAPAFIGGVAVEAEADVVPDAAHAHGVQGVFARFQELWVAGLEEAEEQEQQLRCHGELRCGAEAAVLAVPLLEQLLCGAFGKLG
jgi:hypothetical protein